MENKHTPGPWRISQHDDFRIECGALTIANVVENSMHRMDEAQANAKLIVAAPDLLAALEAIADQWMTKGEVGVSKIDAARRAIAKARGE
jgi:hypothetical protein